MLAGCGGSSSDPSSDSAFSGEAGVGAGRLPGETVNDFYQRLTNECMAPYGYPYTMSSSFLADGSPSGFRLYGSDPVIQKRLDACIAESQQGIGVRKLSPVELEENWAFQTTVMQCLIDKGYDMGTLVSSEEFVAAGGQVVAAVSKLSEFGTLDQLDAAADMDACVAAAS